MSENKKNRELSVEELKKASGGNLNELNEATQSRQGSGLRRIDARRAGADTGSGTGVELDPLGSYDQASPQQRNELDPLGQ